MEALRELLAKFTIEVEGADELKDTNEGLDEGADASIDFASGLKIAGAAIAALGLGALVVKTWEFVEAQTAAVDETGKLATTLEISTDAIQKWTHVATTSGGSVSDVSGAMRRLSKNLFEAQRTAGPAREAFEKLGVAWEDDEGNLVDLETAMFDSAVAIGGMSNNSEKLAIAQETVGRGALKLIPGFKGTREEMKATLDQMGDLAGLMDEDFIRASEDANDQLHFMRNQFAVLRSVVAGALLPAFRWVVTGVRAATDAIVGFLRETGLIDRWLKVGALGALVGALKLVASNWGLITKAAIKFLAILKPFLPIIAKFLIWALVLDDIVTFLQGGDSALGRLLDTLFGAGTAEAVLEGLKTGFANLLIAIELVGFGASALFDDLGRLVGWIGEQFEALWAKLKELGAWLMDIGRSLFGDFADEAVGAIGRVIGKVADLILKFSGLGAAWDTIKDLGGTLGAQLFEGEDAKLNAEAADRALVRSREAARTGAKAPGGGSSSSSVNDSSRVTVNLSGAQSPATVRAATSEARKIKGSNRGAQNALVRGAY